ncbi:hydrogenase/urease maturation nickel metallochaperone HypA [Desulfobotulus sp.]|uniref:hydrogenase/urease maturation nickel metallochaperone HypA n=1 Tax=Desulfobotulus sp. TaxID=1940337 RepID=UPI0039B97F97
MHELPVMTKILAVACRHGTMHGVRQIRSITVGVGVLSDLEPEWMQHYFDRISRGGPGLRRSFACTAHACPVCGQKGEARLYSAWDTRFWTWKLCEHCFERVSA